MVRPSRNPAPSGEKVNPRSQISQHYPEKQCRLSRKSERISAKDRQRGDPRGGIVFTGEKLLSRGRLLAGSTQNSRIWLDKAVSQKTICARDLVARINDGRAVRRWRQPFRTKDAWCRVLSSAVSKLTHLSTSKWPRTHTPLGWLSSMAGCKSSPLRKITPRTTLSPPQGAIPADLGVARNGRYKFAASRYAGF